MIHRYVVIVKYCRCHKTGFLATCDLREDVSAEVGDTISPIHIHRLHQTLDRNFWKLLCCSRGFSILEHLYVIFYSSSLLPDTCYLEPKLEIFITDQRVTCFSDLGLPNLGSDRLKTRHRVRHSPSGIERSSLL
jgi:hypothetical protein